MNQKEHIFQKLKERWYPQGFNCTPFLLIPPASSGFDLHPVLGDSFKYFIFEFKNEYGKMYYPIDDLERLGAIVVNKIKQNKEFLIAVKEKSNYIYASALKEVETIPVENWASLPNKDFLVIMQRAMYLLRTGGIYGHIIEPFSLTMDAMMKKMLSKYVQNPSELNRYLSILATPTQRSFLHEREEDLFKISKIKDKNQRKKEIGDHLKNFYWVRNTYAGRMIITPADIEKELKTVHYMPHDPLSIKKKKQEIMQKLRLDKELVELLEASDFMTNWQDKRKKDIFMAIEKAELVLRELSRRTKIEIKLLRYLSYPDIKLPLFSDKALTQKLMERRNGVVFYITANQELSLTGKEYEEFQIKANTTAEKKQEMKEFNGMTASLGTAVGPVKICKNIQDINEVKEGDILVASMTRPEFLPAMKKAAAIVTDEGGITSHAAIIARELKKPCIIGTKIATHILKNGMTVEVKANHGLIVIL